MDRRRKPRESDPTLLGRRTASRARIALPASIEAITGRTSVDLLNLSCTGAMVAAPGLPGVGHDVILRCGTINPIGVVIWSGNGRCGVHFDEPLPVTEVIALRRAGDATARTGITPDQWQFAEDWSYGRCR